MLKNWEHEKIPGEEELEERLLQARTDLMAKQMQIKEKKLPVVVLFEGFGAAGKGSVLGRVIKNLDPRFFKVETMKKPTKEEKRKPFLYRHFVKIPEEGKFAFFDGGWMDEVTSAYLHGKLKEQDYKNRIQSIRQFERQLTDNGYLVMKFFFYIDKKEQKKRLEGLNKDKNTAWRVGKDDIWQNEHYNDFIDVYDQYLFDTNLPTAPWYLIDSTNKKWAQLQFL